MERFQYVTLPALLIGIAFSGAVIEAFGLFTEERIDFELLFRRGLLGFLALPLVLLAGPFIVMRDVWELKAETYEERLVQTIAALVVFGWSLASGHLLLRVIAGVMEQFDIA